MVLSNTQNPAAHHLSPFALENRENWKQVRKFNPLTDTIATRMYM